MQQVGSWALRALALALALAAASGCSPPSGEPVAGTRTSATTAQSAPATASAPRRTLPPGFLKGQLHVHTGKSGDSETPPQAVHAWYEARGYDFIVFTDHNTVTDTPDTAMLTIPGVEITQNLRTCDPPPRAGDSCLLHVNVLFAGETAGARQLLPPSSTSRIDLYRHGLELSNALGGVAMLNHPNMHFAADATLIAQLAEAKLPLMEVANQSWDCQNEGDATHPSTEALWDDVLSRGHRVWGTVTDDAHHYDDAAAARARGERVFVGDIGFVVVRAEKSGPAIRAALERGEFYGSTGVVFKSIELSRTRAVLEVDGVADVHFQVIGAGGKLVHEATGRRLEYTPRATDGSYVRFRVSDKDGRFALTQPVFL
jgi:hypothetical protein